MVFDVADATNFDQLSIVGALNIGSGPQLTLNIAPGSSFAPGLSFLLISNDGSDPISGTFGNAPISGNRYTLGGTDFFVNYAGGDGKRSDHYNCSRAEHLGRGRFAASQLAGWAGVGASRCQSDARNCKLVARAIPTAHMPAA